MISRIFAYLKKATHVVVLLSYLFHGIAPAIATSVMGSEDDCFSLAVKTSTYQKGNYAYPQITLTLGSGDEESESLTITPFTPLHKMSGMRGLVDEQNRSLGFTYRAKTLGQMLICWDGSLLLHNLKNAAPNLRIETDGSILLNGVSGGNAQLQGRDIYFNGTNRFNALSLSFNDQGAARMAQVLSKSALITQELSLYSGLLLNDGEISVSGNSLMHGAHLVNEGTFETDTLQFDEKGTLKNKGTLKSTKITAPSLKNLENYGPLSSDFEVTSKRIINTGSIQGTGTMRADSFINEGLMGDDATVVRVGKEGVNLGILKAHRIGGGGHFKNHHKLQVQELSVSEFTNQPDETLDVQATVEGESLHLTRYVRSFTNDRDASIEVNKLTMEKRQRNPRLITNRGHVKGKDGKGKTLTLQGTVSNTGEIEADDFTWEGDTFLNQGLEATKARLKGDTFTNRGNLEIGGGRIDVSEFINKGIATLTLKPSSYVSHVFNEGSLYLQGGMAIAQLDNAEQGKVRLSHGLSRGTSFNGDHFEQESAQDITIGADNWISFSVERELRDSHYNVGKLLDIRINNESYGGMIYENEIDHETGRVRVQFSNHSLPVIRPNDRIRIYHQTPQIDFDIFTCNNDGQMDVLDVPLLVMISINNARSLVFKESGLLSLTTENRGTITLEGTGDHRLVTLDNEGILRFKVPVWLENTRRWQKPGRIEGAYGVHMPTESLNPLEHASLHLKEDETLYLYGKNFQSTQDTEFNHNLSIMAETFNNRATVKGRDVSVHATESGQNPGTLKATRRLEVDLPQIDSLGTLISQGDLIFKTQDRSLTLGDTHWLTVGRNLTMKLLNGDLHVKAKLQFPGDVKVKASSFTLKGDLKVAGDIHIKTQGDIEVKAKTYEIKPPLSTQDLWLQALGHPIFNFNPEPSTYEYVLSKLTSGGVLTLIGQNVNNLGGQVYGAQSLNVNARNNLTNGTQIKTMRAESRIGHANGGLFHYKVPEAKGIGAYLATLGPLSLTAGFAFQNIHGTLFAGDTLSITGPHFMTNMAGQIISVGDAHLEGGTFSNIREPIVTVATGPANNSDHNHRWYVNGELKYSGKNNGPTQQYAGSRPATLQTLGNLTLDFRSKITNQMSEIMAGGASHIIRALVENQDPVPLSAWIRREGDGSWPEYKVNAGILMSPMSSNEMFTITTPQEVLNGGIISSPHIYINGPKLLQIGSKDSTPRSSHGSVIRTSGGVDCIPLAPYAHQLGEDLRTIMGSLPHPSLPDITVIMDQNTRMTLSMSRLLFSPHMEMFGIQRGYMDHYRKGYLWPHLSPLEHSIRLRENAQRMALRQGRSDGPSWAPLMITEAEADKTTVPMILFRPIIEDGREGLAPELFIPHDMIQPILLEDEPAVVADDVFESSDVHMTSVTGNVHGGNEVIMSGHTGFLGHRIEHQQTPHGYKQTPVGGNITTDKGGKVDLQFEGPFKTSGGTITAEDGTVSIASNGMDLSTIVTRTYHNDRETLIDDTTQHPLHIESGDIRVNSSSYLNATAIQGIASRTLNMIAQDDIAFPSAENTHHFEQQTCERDVFGGKNTRTEVRHSTTHQVANLRGGERVGVRSVAGNIRATAPKFTAPKIVLDFPNGALLLQAFKNTYFYNVETSESNAFLNTHTTSGSQSVVYGGTELNGEDISFTRGRPTHAEIPEHEQYSETAETLRNAGANLHIVHNEFRSWEETKTSVGPGLSALIAIGVSMIMPGIGTGVSGAMLTKGAETLGAQALVGMINNGGNILKTLEDMASPDALRNVATSMATAGLTQKLSEITKIPLDPKGSEFVDHLESRMIHMAAQIPVETALSRKGFGEVFQDSLTCAASKLVGSYGAANIGSFCDSYQVAEFGQYLAHAAVGAAAAKVREGDVAASAIGGVVGRAVGNHLQEEMDKYGITEDHLDYERALDRAVNIARFSAASFACVLGQDAEDAACAAANAARYVTVSSSPFTQKTPAQEAYAAMRREGISEEMAKAALNNPQFQRLLQEGLSFDAEVQQSEAYHAQILREAEEATKSSGILHLEVYPYRTPTDMALEYFQKAAVFTNEHPHLTAAAFYGLQIAIGGPLNVLRGMVQDVLIGDQRDAIRQVLKTSIANHLNITEQSDAVDKLKFDIAFASGEFGAGFLLGAGIKVVKDSAQNVAKAIRREERVLQTSVIPSKKRTATTEPTQIEASVTPNAKASRTKDKTSPGGGEKIHKNSKEYAGDTHVYSIHRARDGKTYKVGQSAQGTRKKDGASKRAESQARKLRKETGELYITKIRKELPNKKDGLSYETRLIKKTRSIKGKDALPGNKNDR